MVWIAAACGGGSNAASPSRDAAAGSAGASGVGGADASAGASNAGGADASAGASGADAASDGLAGNGAAGAGGGTAKPLGAPCTDASECASHQCTDVGKAAAKLVCTETCPSGQACPLGYCAWQEGSGYVCMPDAGDQCSPCNSGTDCANAGDACVASPRGDRFCARDCSFDESCPSGFECVLLQSYGPADGGAAGAGSTQPDPRRVCVPAAGQSCPCTSAYDSQERTCMRSYGPTICQGKETCNGSQGQWVGCDAAPRQEICNGQDDDCNGSVDDGSSATLCDICPPGAPQQHVVAAACGAGKCHPLCEIGWQDSDGDFCNGCEAPM